jgi:DNA-binding response OmpR family regulator
MIRLALEHSGYEVDVAADGQEGLLKFGDGKFWDLVLLDQRMPGLSGMDVQKEIYHRSPKTKLILITAFGTIDLALEAIQAGASDFLRKPFTVETLKKCVISALERPVTHMAAVPVGLVCREFTRTTFNGFGFELEDDHTDEHIGDITCRFKVHRAGEAPVEVKVVLPAFVMELVKAYTDSEHVPGGQRFWVAMCEEALANHLWQNASPPDDAFLRIDDLSSGLQRWLDSVLTVCLADDSNGR